MLHLYYVVPATNLYTKSQTNFKVQSLSTAFNWTIIKITVQHKHEQKLFRWWNTSEINTAWHVWTLLGFCVVDEWTGSSHPEDGGSTLLRNVGTLTYYMVQKPRRRPSTDILAHFRVTIRKGHVNTFDCELVFIIFKGIYAVK